MDKQSMAEILLELKNELANNQSLGHHERQRMEALAEEVERRINDPEAEMPSDEFLLSRLQQETESFEIQHPKLTEIIARLADLLARMGI